ncbi:MAG: HlyD family secretion protein [Proteobacteria bacterium]|nr:HlyD family secretion protein [Pseudomonadota bacterium]
MTTRPPLFRPESMEAARTAWIGQPSIDASPSRRAFAIASLFFVVVIVLLLVFGNYTRRVRVTGVVLPAEGLARLSAPQSGWISELRVRDGDLVKRGDILYVLSVDSTTSLGNTQSAVTALLRRKGEELELGLERQANLDRTDKLALQDRIARGTRELAQADAQIQLSERTTAQMEITTERIRNLAERGMATARDHETRQETLTSYRVQLEALRRERIQVEMRLAEARNQLASFDLQADTRRAEVRRQILDIQQQISENEARRELRIVAPRDGRITSISTLVGQTVTVGKPLLTIVPADRPLVVQLLAPSTAIGFVREEARVLLRYQAFPYQKFGQYPGSVTLISRATLLPEEVTQLNVAMAEGARGASLYRITVQPDQPFVTAYGRPEALQSGMLAEAHILAETRPLYQWIFEPLYSLKESVSNSEGAARDRR